MVLLHVALTVTTDLLSAVILGLLFTAASFIVEYSRHSGVLQRATLQLERSKVLRAAADLVRVRVRASPNPNPNP